MFKEVFLRIAKEYSKEKLGEEKGIDANFMIIDDGLAAIAATPERFDVVVTSNMFGDIGSDVAAKVSGGVGLVSSNNTNPNDPMRVSMFETMGGTADDIAGKNLANPVALIDAAAEMLLHIGGADNVRAAELVKTAILQVLADGYYVGDIKKGPYQAKKGKERLGTQEFAQKIIERMQSLQKAKAQNPSRSIKEIALAEADAEVRSLFEKALRSYEKYAAEYAVGTNNWVQQVTRNLPPNPILSTEKIQGFDFFVDDSGMRLGHDLNGKYNPALTHVDRRIKSCFKQLTQIDLATLFNESSFGSLQAIRSFAQYAHTHLSNFVKLQLARDNDAVRTATFESLLLNAQLHANLAPHFAAQLLQLPAAQAMERLDLFNAESIKLIQSFYYVRAKEFRPVLRKHGFELVRTTSRGTEIFPTMCDFEKREVDRYRVEIDPNGPLVGLNGNQSDMAIRVSLVQQEMARKHWIVVEKILNRQYCDVSGPQEGKLRPGVSVPYGKSLGVNYESIFDAANLHIEQDDDHDVDLEHD